MTNEELVALIQAGKRDRLLDLWAQVRLLALKVAQRWNTALDGRGGVTMDDLEQHGFLAMMNAVDHIDLSCETKFSTYLVPCLKTEYSKAFGLRTMRQKMDPIHHALSLDLPLSDEPDSETMIDFQIDPLAELAFEDVEEQERRQAVELALQSLTEQQREVIRLRYWYGFTQDKSGKILKITGSAVRQLEAKALRKLRHPVNSRKLREYV